MLRLFFAEREGLATTQASLLRLTPFPCLAGRLLAKMSTAQGVDKSTYFVSTSLRPTNKFVCEQCKNKKMSIKSTSPCFVRFFCGKGGIRTPGTVTRTPHFECGPIDHSGTFPCAFCGANVRIYFVIPTISNNILHFFCVRQRFEYDFINICVIFAYTKNGFIPV